MSCNVVSSFGDMKRFGKFQIAELFASGWGGKYRYLIAPDKYDIKVYASALDSPNVGIARISNPLTKVSKNGRVENATIVKVNFKTCEIFYPTKKTSETDGTTFQKRGSKMKSFIVDTKDLNEFKMAIQKGVPPRN